MSDGLDLDALTGYLAPFSSAVDGAMEGSNSGTTSGPGRALRAELIQGGKSNLTYRLTTTGCYAGRRSAMSWQPLTTWPASIA
jgi:hypothetical protein